MTQKRTGWGWAVYKKHTGSKIWERVGSYRLKAAAEGHAKRIRSKSKYMQTKIHKVKLRTVK